jgi:hypothetical protein
MSVNRGKKFEDVIKTAFEKVPGVSIDRLHDQTTGYAGSSNICDFIVYKEPYEYYIECKSVHGNTLSINGNNPKHKYGNITNTQWEGLLEKSKIEGVHAGIICWWVDKDVTAYLPIEMLQYLRDKGYKSVSYIADWVELAVDAPDWDWCWITGKKKRVFFDYDMEEFLNEVGEEL